MALVIVELRFHIFWLWVKFLSLVRFECLVVCKRLAMSLFKAIVSLLIR